MKKRPLIILSFSFVSCAWSQSAVLRDDAIFRQRTSIETQQAAIRKQLANADSAPGKPTTFFLLPRAARTSPATTLTTMAVQPAWNCPALPASQISTLTSDAANAEGLSVDLLRGVMKQESGFHPCAVSSKGALGLMQLMPDTARQLGVTSPLDPAANVTAGAKLLKQLLTRYSGDLSKTLGAYNAGTSRVDAVDGVPAIPETQDYVRQILASLIQ